MFKAEKSWGFFCQGVEHNLLNTEHEKYFLSITCKTFVQLKAAGIWWRGPRESLLETNKVALA